MPITEPNAVASVRYCGRPSNPIFCPADRMRKQDRAAFERWQGWAVFQMLLVYRTSSVFSSKRLSPIDDTLRFLYALHDGMRYFAGRERGLRSMPAIPAVWPNEFPFDLAWSFVEILQKQMDNYPALAAAEEVEWKQQVSSKTDDCPPPTE